MLKSIINDLYTYTLVSVGVTNSSLNYRELQLKVSEVGPIIAHLRNLHLGRRSSNID